MRITLMPMNVMFATTALQIPLCYLFMIHLDYGIIGLAYATGIKDFLTWMIVTFYGSCSAEISKALTPIDMEAFRGWKEYLKIAMPSTVMICAEWWAFQVILVFAGIISVDALACCTIVMSLIRLFLMVSLGI